MHMPVSGEYEMGTSAAWEDDLLLVLWIWGVPSCEKDLGTVVPWNVASELLGGC